MHKIYKKLIINIKLFIEKYENFINKLSTGKSLLKNIINKYS